MQTVSFFKRELLSVCCSRKKYLMSVQNGVIHPDDGT